MPLYRIAGVLVSVADPAELRQRMLTNLEKKDSPQWYYDGCRIVLHDIDEGPVVEEVKTKKGRKG